MFPDGWLAVQPVASPVLLLLNTLLIAYGFTEQSWLRCPIYFSGWLGCSCQQHPTLWHALRPSSVLAGGLLEPGICLFPLLSAGTYGHPRLESTPVLSEVISRLSRNPCNIYSATPVSLCAGFVLLPVVSASKHLSIFGRQDTSIC